MANVTSSTTTAKAPAPKHGAKIQSEVSKGSDSTVRKELTAKDLNKVFSLPRFVTEQAPSSTAAALRFAITSETLANWSRAINETDTKNMPQKLLDAYQIAFQAIKMVCEQERAIALQED